MVRDASETCGKAQPQVFISYASQDAEQVIQIVRLLEHEGATIWRDQEHILGGQYYGEQIVHAIAHSRVVILMCSPHAFHSDNVHREVLLTWDHYHRSYIPVWLCPATEIPDRFRYCLTGCQWIDAHTQPPECWLPQLIKAFKALGVDTRNSATNPGEPPRRSADETNRRGLRFRPGDKPIQGADWELERLLGKGGFGEVWRAHNTHLSSVPPVALKFCLELDDRAKGLLTHEADMVLRAQQQIRSHGIVPLLHAYLSNDPPCLEYPYIEGGTMVRLLDDFRDSAGSFAPVQVERIIHRIAQIIGPAHRAAPKLVHRDLKPSNVLVQHRGEGKLVLRVTDFGIGGIAAQPILDRSRSSSSMRENMSSVLAGSYSPLYASPQQMRGDRPDPRDDVYALGVIWYQFLMGDLASPAPTGRKWIDVLRARGMSDAAVQLLSSCVESDTAYRPADAGILAEQIQALPATIMTKPARSKADLNLVEAEPHPSLEPFPAPHRVGTPLPPGEPSSKPPRTQRRAPEVPKSQHVTTVPSVQHAETPSTSDDFGTTGAFKRWVAAGALGLVGLLGIIIYVATDNGTVEISGTDPNMVVRIDGQEIRIENLGKVIKIRTGPHKLLVTRDDLEVQTETFVIRRGEDKVLAVTYNPKRPLTQQGGNKKAAFPSPSLAEGSKPASSTAKIQTSASGASLPSLENLLIIHSVWKGPYAFEGGTNLGQMELYIQERAGRTFRGIHVSRGVHAKPNRGMWWVEGVAREGVFSYHSRAPDAQFNVTGALKGENLEVVITNPDGSVAEATLKREADKPESARVVFSVFQNNDTDGWYTMNQDGSGNATQPITFDSRNGRCWLVALPVRNPNEFGWHAPPKYHGDHSGKHGRWLICLLNATEVRHTPLADWYVRLRGSEMTLYLDGTDLQPPPGKLIPKIYCVRLDASFGWKKFPSRGPATDEEIRSVLAGVSDLRIKGEFGIEAGGCLQDVEFGADDPFKDVTER